MPRAYLAPFPVLAAVMGLAYLYGDPGRTAAPSFAAARTLAPMTVWGVVFLAGALALTLTLVAGHRQLLAIALTIGGCMFTWWAALFAISAATDPEASLTGWAIHGFIGAAHFTAAHAIRTRP